MDALVKIIWMLLAAPLWFLIALPVLRSIKLSWLFIIVHSILLTTLTIFLFNKPYWRWADHAGLIEATNTADTAAYNFVNDKFILVDNSFDKMLLPNPDGDVDDYTTVPVTNRQTLISFLQLLKININKVDLVVSDIGFNMETPDDSCLQKELSELYKENKLLLSHTTGNELKFITDNRIYGNIDEKASNNLFVTHSIKRENGISLAYLLYGKINKIEGISTLFSGQVIKEKKIGGKSFYAMNTFFPEFQLNNETLLTGLHEQQNDLTLANTADTLEKKVRNYYLLSESLYGTGANDFIANLATRKRQGLQNIILLGSFASPIEDLHQTLYGNLHGPTILLNLVYSLQKKNHYLTLTFLISLFLGFILITWVLLSRAKRTEAPATSRPVSFISFFKFMFEFLFVEELHFVLLFLFFFLLKWQTGNVINVMSLLIWFSVMSMSFKYVWRHSKS